MKNKILGFLAIAVLCFSACDEEPVPVVLPTLAISDATMAEGNSGNTNMIFTVTLEGESAANVIVSYATVNGTALGDNDFVAEDNGQINISPGETEKTITIKIKGDEVNENDETFEVLLLNPVNATLKTARGKGTITNDDGPNVFTVPTTGYTTPNSYAGMTQVWGDEFNGTTLNTADWNYETGTGSGGWGNNELQYYRQENTSIFDGEYLVIEGKQENFAGSDYTSSRLTTQGKKEFQYGRIDIRAVLPEGQGIWPALWMLGANINSVGWPACGEIDIMEMVGHQANRVHGTVHFGANVANHQYVGTSTSLTGGAIFKDEFHVFSLVWEENKIEWYVDDVLYNTVTPATTGAHPYPFNAPFFMIFNLAIGGDWPGTPDATTNFPQYLIVDYIRVFQ